MCKITKCKKAPAKNKGGLCHSCAQERYKQKNPIYYAFYVHRNNAKRRGIVYGLTFEDFKKFAVKTNYMNNKGRSAEGYHIDRIDERKGYFKGNIQALKNKDNVRKSLAFRLSEKGTPEFRYNKAVEVEDSEDYPF